MQYQNLLWSVWNMGITCINKVAQVINVLKVDTNLNSVQHVFGKLAGVKGSICFSSGLWERANFHIHYILKCKKK